MRAEHRLFACRRTTGDTLLPLPLGERWDAAASVALGDALTGDAPALATRVRALWNGAAVYFRFECEDDHICASYENRDDPLYDEDVVELFVSPDGDLRRYYEFELSPRNVLFDAVVSNDLRGNFQFDASWDSAGARTWTAVDLPGRSVGCEIAIPFADFGRQAPAAEEWWRINLFRIDRARDGWTELSAWQTTGAPRFHLPEKFGYLLFVH